MLKMLGLYIDTLLIGHKCCRILSKINELTLQMELQYVMRNNVIKIKKVKTKQQQKEKSKVKNRCRSRDSKAGHLASQADA